MPEEIFDPYIGKWMDAYIELHKEDIPNAKFKVGQKVHYQHSIQKHLVGEGIITAVNNAGSYEYAIEGITILFWECELSLPAEPPAEVW